MMPTLSSGHPWFDLRHVLFLLQHQVAGVPKGPFTSTHVETFFGDSVFHREIGVFSANPEIVL